VIDDESGESMDGTDGGSATQRTGCVRIGQISAWLAVTSILSPPHSLIPGLNLPFSANTTHCSLPFVLGTDYIFPDCLLIRLSLSVF